MQPRILNKLIGLPEGNLPTLDAAQRDLELSRVRVRNLRAVLGASRSWCGLDGARWRPGFPIPRPAEIVLELEAAKLSEAAIQRVVNLLKGIKE